MSQIDRISPPTGDGPAQWKYRMVVPEFAWGIIDMPLLSEEAEIVEWLNDRLPVTGWASGLPVAHWKRAEGGVYLMNDDDIAFEFRMRWC